MTPSLLVKNLGTHIRCVFSSRVLSYSLQNGDISGTTETGKGECDMKTAQRMLCFFCLVAILLMQVSCAESENVFDQLYDEVKSVKKGNESVLLTGTQTAYADYDFGFFENIQIPDLDMCLDFDDQSLYILFFNHSETEEWNSSFYVLYRYDVRDKTLYGERELDYLNENFLSHYFAWWGAAKEPNAYSLKNLGTYTFLLQEQVNYN